MSSFIVDKKEFIKAAGLMYGFEEAKGCDRHQWFLDNVRKDFEHAYALNVASVNEQYFDKWMPNEESYDDVFESYRKQGRIIATDGYDSSNGIIFTKVKKVMNKDIFRLSMQNFFNSVLYQIENDAANRAVSALFYGCMNKLYGKELRTIEGWWGSIDMEV